MQGVRLLAANQDFVSSTTAITIFILPLMPGQRLREVEPHLLFQSSLSDILQQPWMLCSFHLTLPIFHDIHLQILMLGQNFRKVIAIVYFLCCLYFQLYTSGFVRKFYPSYILTIQGSCKRHDILMQCSLVVHWVEHIINYDLNILSITMHVKCS